MRSVILAATLVAWALAATTSLAGDALVSETDIFISGDGSYSAYRIPAVVVTPRDTLLAFCEGRREGLSDAGNIDLLVRRSLDGGKTWSEPRVIWDDGPNTCGNPCPVVDRETGTVWLLMTWNAGSVHESKVQPGFGEDSRRVYVTHSRDDGESWAVPVKITESVKDQSWSWYATGPGAGIQLANEEHRGRLVIPCDHKVTRDRTTHFYSHVNYSDDHGETWRMGGTSPKDQVNECEVVELADGQLMLNMRNYDRSEPTRQICLSDDGGITWHSQHHDAALVEPVCQASIRRYRWPGEDRPGIILFSNPASAKARENLTIRASYDEGTTWPDAAVLHPGSSAYSCLVTMADGTIGCLYEKNGYQKITFAQFPLEWFATQNEVTRDSAVRDASR